MSGNDYDPVGGHTKEEADAAYAELFRELHGEEIGGGIDSGDWNGSRDCIGNEGWNGNGNGGSGAQGADGGRREKVAVIGHRNPDTDCVCSAIAYARLKNETDQAREYVPYRLGPVGGEAAYVLERFGAPVPELLEDINALAEGGDCRKPGIILVDHNDMAESVAGAGGARILEIIDHHRLASVETAYPVFFRSQPCGATGTIVYQLYNENGAVPDRNAAGLLCAAIISDTMLFRSPTTAHIDRLSAAALANLAGLDIEAFAAEMFSSGNGRIGTP